MKSEEKELSRTDGADLTKLLQTTDLSRYENKIRSELKLRNASDLQYVDEVDLTGIGMSRPEQKRLRKEYERLFPSGFVGKIKKVFARGESSDRKEAGTGKEEDEEQHVIPLERITLCKELGKGEFGAVWQASWKNSATKTETMQVAVKCVAPDKLVASSSSFLQEAAIMTRMQHENVVRLYGVVLDTKRVMMVSELASCGSLLECLQKAALRDSFPVHVLCDYAEQIALGMSYLESQRLIHRDLAARNVLVFNPKKVKISDFGLSRSLGVGEDYYRSEFTPNLKLPIAWCAPECINFLKFTSASDVWAYGVTLWEMFSYGAMPWNGMTGAEILSSIDRERRYLTRPVTCPDDMYITMKECWTHSAAERPTFSHLVTLFPERHPQTVRAIIEGNDSAVDHLQFKKDELITVIDRSPSTYPDGYYWFGSLRNGRTGLFRPSDTVAHLGAENPSTNKSFPSVCVGGAVDRKEVKKPKKLTKEEEREKRKALISEPVGDVRHTCHVGIDGTAFGLNQLNKKEELAPPSTSPSTIRSSNSSSSHISPVILRSELGREGVPIKETVSMREISGTTSPPVYRAPMQPGSRASLQPTAPPLTASAENSMNKEAMREFEYRKTSTQRSVDSATNTLPSIMTSEDELLTINRRNHPKPVSAVYARSPGSNLPSPSAKSEEVLLEEEVRHLERDLTDFSLSSYNDCEEPPMPTPSSSDCSSITRPPYVCLSPPVTTPQRRNGETEKETNNPLRGNKEESVEFESSFTRSHLRVDQQPTGTDWSEAAQEAYKLLVECGTSLKQTSSPAISPVPSRNTTMDRKEKHVRIAENPVSPPPPRPRTPPQQEKVNESCISYSPQGKVHIIQTKILDSPANIGNISNLYTPPGLPPKGALRQPPTLPSKTRQVPVMVDGRSLNYDNLNGVGAGKVPPPVPPKPRMDSSLNRPPSTSPPPPASDKKGSPGCAPSIARSALFTSSKTEEVVKF